MFSYFNELRRTKFRPIYLAAGDALQITWRDESGTETVLCEKRIGATQAMTITEGVLFEAVYDGRRALGGLVLEEN